MITPYDRDFYSAMADAAASSAAQIIPKLIEYWRPSSVIDVGCGTGTWLSGFRAGGVERVLGVDGPWVRGAGLQLESEEFIEADLEGALPVACEGFDLALCLEVAEHLSEAASDLLVENLARAADVVVFSAAIPGQGGTDHRNEQPPGYWVTKFQRHGFCVDATFRFNFWNLPEVSFYYSQNMMIFARERALCQVPLAVSTSFSYGATPLHVVHPRLVDDLVGRLNILASAPDARTVQPSALLRALPVAVWSAIKRRVRLHGRQSRGL